MPYQFVPPGFQMITLPYSDDIRLPEREPGFTGTEHMFADDAQVRLMPCQCLNNSCQSPAESGNDCRGARHVLSAIHNLHELLWLNHCCGHHSITLAAMQVAAAEKLIDALQLPEEFDTAAISNPTLQRFYEAHTHTACNPNANLRSSLCLTEEFSWASLCDPLWSP